LLASKALKGIKKKKEVKNDLLSNMAPPWLNSLYDIDLSTNTYETGFNTDLHEIVKQITDSHDSNYKQ
jgi:hypothetical protein